MPRLLIIDDDRDLLEVCAMVLEDEGFEVQTVDAPNKEPLLETVHSFKPQLILLDLVMPVAGASVARWLYADPVARPVPVVVMSALSTGLSEARQLGATSFLPKPFTAERLVAEVRDRLEARPGPQQKQ